MYVLMHQDTKVLAFDEEQEIVYEPRLLPEAVHYDSLYGFLYMRATAFRARETYVALVKTLGVEDYRDMMTVIDKTHGLSLTDDYWIKKEEENCTFEELNLYDHPFDGAPMQAGYLGIAKGQGTYSPEYTTDGQLPKCYDRQGDQIVLYKRGSTWGEAPGREMYNEYYAHQVLDALGVPHVPYDLTMYKGHLASVCPLVTSQRYSYVPISAFNYAHEDDIFGDFIKRGMSKEIRTMILFDALVYNYDRHIGNFGYLKDHVTGTYSFFPLFDHGDAFFPLFQGQTMAELDAYLPNIAYSAMGIPFDALVSQYCTSEEGKLLEKLNGFMIHPHPKYGENVDLYNAFLKKRITELQRIIFNVRK